MFGTQNDSKKQDTPLVNDQTFSDINTGAAITMPSYSDNTQSQTPAPAAPAAAPASTPSVTDSLLQGIQPAQQPAPAPTFADSSQQLTIPAPTPLPQIQLGSQAAQAPQAPASSYSLGAPTPDATQAPADENDLMNIKHEALSQLSPLVSHIEQTPSEKFRTLMMMIQGADDKTLIKPAYDAAKAIEDERERAQALLDIVNEINYFTQPKDQGQQQQPQQQAAPQL